MKISGLKNGKHGKTAQQKAFPASADGEDGKSLL